MDLHFFYYVPSYSELLFTVCWSNSSISLNAFLFLSVYDDTADSICEAPSEKGEVKIHLKQEWIGFTSDTDLDV